MLPICIVLFVYPVFYTMFTALKSCFEITASHIIFAVMKQPLSSVKGSLFLKSHIIAEFINLPPTILLDGPQRPAASCLALSIYFIIKISFTWGQIVDELRRDTLYHTNGRPGVKKFSYHQIDSRSLCINIHLSVNRSYLDVVNIIYELACIVNHVRKTRSVSLH